jgi:hypothetical protein
MSDLIPTVSSKDFIKQWSKLLKHERCRCRRDSAKGGDQGTLYIENGQGHIYVSSSALMILKDLFSRPHAW